MLLINSSAPLTEIDSDEAALRCPVRKLILIYFFLQNSSENICAGVPFGKFAGLQPKWDSNTEVFLQISSNS